MRLDTRLRFPSTLWSLVFRAGHGTGRQRKQAMAELAGAYLRPLREYLLLQWRLDRHDADDMVQGFLADKVLEHDLLSRADRGRGKFRTFLLAALDSYVSDRLRYERREKRGAGNLVPLETSHENATEGSPAAAFELAWARQVLGQAIRRTRRECSAEYRSDVWGVFRARVLDHALRGTEPMPYKQLIAKYRLATPAQVGNLLTTGKRMFTRNLHDVLSQYEVDEKKIEAEIADLYAILARRAGQGRGR